MNGRRSLGSTEPGLQAGSGLTLMKTLDLKTLEEPQTWQAAVREFVRRARDELGDRLARVVLYGSYARGEQNAGSDVDLLVTYNGPFDYGDEISRLSRIAFAVNMEYDVFVVPMPESEKMLADEGAVDGFIETVREEGINV
jgi:predicted nucleotidyltransferase